MTDFETSPITDEAVRLATAKAVISPETIESLPAAMRPRVAVLLRQTADQLDPAPASDADIPKGTAAGNEAAASDTQAAPEAPAENPLARFKAHYEALPAGNILAQGCTWQQVETRLTDPKNADKLRKVREEMDEPRLYAVMEDGSLEFVDGNPDTPPMFVKDNETGTLQIIFKCDPKQMTEADVQVEAKTHQWASIQEMLDWAQENGFDVFEADTKDERKFGKEMKLAESASPTGFFVGKSGGPWMATALKDARYAYFHPGYGVVDVHDPNPRNRDGYLGLLRRLRV